MGQLEALFLVNGGPGSAAGERAERIARALPHARSAAVYRRAGRRGATGDMLRALRRSRRRVPQGSATSSRHIAGSRCARATSWSKTS